MAEQPRFPFQIKPENVMIYELESNDNFNFDELPPEKQQEIRKKNDQYEATAIRNSLIEKSMPCQCLMPVMAERARRRASIIPSTVGPNGQINIQLEQQDIDQKDFIVIVNEDDGLYTDVRMVVSHCKNCGELHAWGDLGPIGDLVAKAFVDYDTTQEKRRRQAEKLKELIGDGPKAPDGQPTFMLEDTDTGKMTPADDLMDQLTGKAPRGETKSGIILEDN